MSRKITIAALESYIHEFNKARQWQDYHTPKNLACAIAVEAGELLELFQWLTPEQSESLDPGYLTAVSDEMADIFIFLLILARNLQIDLATIVIEKVKRNSDKYPPGREFNPFGKALE